MNTALKYVVVYVWISTLAKLRTAGVMTHKLLDGGSDNRSGMSLQCPRSQVLPSFCRLQYGKSVWFFVHVGGEPGNEASNTVMSVALG